VSLRALFPAPNAGRCAKQSPGLRGDCFVAKHALSEANGNAPRSDEPENFLALPEIQPWLLQLYDSCSEGKTQALLISHHPELINYLLASPVGYWFEREANTPVRVKQIVAESNGGLPVSELIARGWLNA